jgi:excisionase family DNA binding protein
MPNTTRESRKPKTKQDSLPDLLTTTEAGNLIRVTDQCILNWIRRGHVAAIRIGRFYRIPRQEMLNLMKPQNIAAGGARRA